MTERPTIELGSAHVGAKCPACGYVYHSGFSALDVPDTAASGRCNLIPCTRCFRILEVLQSGELRQLNAAELLLLADSERAGLAVLNRLLTPYRKTFQ